MICDNCAKAAKKSEEVFTKTERLHLLAASVSMLRSIQSGPEQSNDLKISSSVITKLLLSFPEEGRGVLAQHFKQSIGMEINLKNCAHGLTVVR